MDDFGDILFYIIAAVIGLITTLGKKRKKKTAKSMPKASESTDNQPYVVVAEQEAQELEYQVGDEDFMMDQIFSEKADEIQEESKNPYTMEPELEGDYSQPLAEQFVYEGKQQLDVEEEPLEEKIEESREENDQLKDFDLREAIIYSEILKRKDY